MKDAEKEDVIAKEDYVPMKYLSGSESSPFNQRERVCGGGRKTLLPKGKVIKPRNVWLSGRRTDSEEKQVQSQAKAELQIHLE